MPERSFWYSLWTLHGRYLVSVVGLLIIAIVLCLLAENLVPALLGLASLFYSWVWIWRLRKVPRRITIGPAAITFHFSHGQTTGPVEAVTFADFRAGDLARPLGRVATFLRNDGAILLADGQMAGGEGALADVLRRSRIDARHE
jgi:hypothetical protein